MKTVIILLVVVAAVASVATAPERVQLILDSSEADAVLAILEKRASGKPVSGADWSAVWQSEPYQRLKKREASMHREFTDEEFKRFLNSEGLAQRAPLLRKTLDAWKKADLKSVGARILPYLPSNAEVKAKVYPVIKPKTNSFVFETATNPAIFLYLNPDESQSEFEDTVAHESHHIGFADASKRYDEKIKALPDNARKAADWMGAFGEGLAVLAAAGSADVHPLHDFNANQQWRWDEDMKSVNDDLVRLDQFFRDIVSGGFTRPDVADHVGFTFFGYRGPWYTVGYRMGQVVEKRFGRAVLVECMADPRMLLAKFNEAAAENNTAGKEKLPLWSDEVLKAVGVAK